MKQTNDNSAVTYEEKRTNYYMSELRNLRWNSKSVPYHLHYGLVRYLVFGVLPGDFLQGVISNDLRKAINHGDEESLEGLGAVVSFLYCVAPSSAWGSSDNMKEWSRLCGEVGRFPSMMQKEQDAPFLVKV